MRRITKQQRVVLEMVLAELKSARDFIQDPEIFIGRKKNAATNTQDFANSAGEVITVVNKEFGSAFTNFYAGLDKLERFLTNES